MVRASSMASATPKACVEQWENPLGKLFGGGVEPVNGAGSDTGLHRIHQDDRGSTLPGFQQFGAVASFLHDREAREILAAQAANDDTTHTVVAAEGVAHPDQQRAAEGRGHSRSTRSFRKCVAQEMQGS